MKRSFVSVLLSATIWLIQAVAANADTMTLYGTGVGLSGSGAVDTHWSWTSGSSSGQGVLVVNTFYNGSPPYAANSATSQWIAMTDTSFSPIPNGATFSYSFDLSAYDISNASLSGLWSIADAGQVFLNGHQLDSSGSSVDWWGTLHAVSAPASDFLAGVNTITMLEQNSDNYYEAVRFEGSVGGLTPVNPVPEPATLLLLGCGLIGLAGVNRFRKQQHRRG